jgi:hypothetical protein
VTLFTKPQKLLFAGRRQGYDNVLKGCGNVRNIIGLRVEYEVKLRTGRQESKRQTG